MQECGGGARARGFLREDLEEELRLERARGQRAVSSDAYDGVALGPLASYCEGVTRACARNSRTCRRPCRSRTLLWCGRWRMPSMPFSFTRKRAPDRGTTVAPR